MQIFGYVFGCVGYVFANHWVCEVDNVWVWGQVLGSVGERVLSEEIRASAGHGGGQASGCGLLQWTEDCLQVSVSHVRTWEVCVCVVCVCVYACVGVNGIERQNGVCHVSMTSLR